MALLNKIIEDDFNRIQQHLVKKITQRFNDDLKFEILSTFMPREIIDIEKIILKNVIHHIGNINYVVK